MSDVEHTAPQLQPSDHGHTAQGQVVAQPGGTLTFTHGYRYPDNSLRVTQTHRADGTLQSARIVWSGFAGELLNLSAEFDTKGKVLRETGYRAQGVKKAVTDFIQPLPPQGTPPQGTAASAPAAATPDLLGEMSRASAFGETSAALTPAVSPAPSAHQDTEPTQTKKS